MSVCAFLNKCVNLTALYMDDVRVVAHADAKADACTIYAGLDDERRGVAVPALFDTLDSSARVSVHEALEALLTVCCSKLIELSPCLFLHDRKRYFAAWSGRVWNGCFS